MSFTLAPDSAYTVSLTSCTESRSQFVVVLGPVLLLRHGTVARILANGSAALLSFNSLRPRDTYMGQWTRPPLFQIMACRLVGAKPLSVPMLKFVNWTLGNKFKWNINRNLYISIQENTFENVAWKMAAILSRPQCVNGYMTRDTGILESMYYQVTSHCLKQHYHNFQFNSKTFYCHSKHIHNSYIKVRKWQWGILKHSLLVPQVFKL